MINEFDRVVCSFAQDRGTEPPWDKSESKGLSAYEAEGAVLIAVAAREKVLRDAAENGDALELKAVKDRMTIEGEMRSVEIIDIDPTAHSPRAGTMDDLRSALTK
ncbi:MAG: hypothetical protein GWP60_09610 [Gammaproteobacteria bacterium]|nr:hypothetical protein [Gammaproteobacteria bacterium]